MDEKRNEFQKKALSLQKLGQAIALQSELMLQHRRTPSIAAISVGYSDFCNFSKMFKQHYGLSPRAYIKAHKEADHAI